MNQKVLKTLEYYKIIERLTDCAASEPGKKMCRELTPSSDFNEIVQAQTARKEVSHWPESGM